MIYDTIDTMSSYAGLSHNMQKAIAFIQKNDLQQLPLGKTPIDGDIIFASVSEYLTKDIAVAKWEAHKVYTDIQILISGEEKIGVAPVKSMSISEEYVPERDVMFFNGTGDYITMKPGMFAIFMPQDAHQPNVTLHAQSNVRKVVFKVKM